MSVSLCQLNYSYLTSGKTCWTVFDFLCISHSLLVISASANFYWENASWLVRLYRKKNEDLPSVSTLEYIKGNMFIF